MRPFVTLVTLLSATACLGCYASHGRRSPTPSDAGATDAVLVPDAVLVLDAPVVGTPFTTVTRVWVGDPDGLSAMPQVGWDGARVAVAFSQLRGERTGAAIAWYTPALVEAERTSRMFDGWHVGTTWAPGIGFATCAVTDATSVRTYDQTGAERTITPLARPGCDAIARIDTGWAVLGRTTSDAAMVIAIDDAGTSTSSELGDLGTLAGIAANDLVTDGGSIVVALVRPDRSGVRLLRITGGMVASDHDVAIAGAHFARLARADDGSFGLAVLHGDAPDQGVTWLPIAGDLSEGPSVELVERPLDVAAPAIAATDDGWAVLWREVDPAGTWADGRAQLAHLAPNGASIEPARTLAADVWPGIDVTFADGSVYAVLERRFPAIENRIELVRIAR